MKNPFEVYTSLHDNSHKRALDWEESAVDNNSYVEGFFDEERTAPHLAWLWLLLGVCFLFMVGRLVDLQIVQGSNFRSLSEGNRIRRQTILAPRGLVRDRFGEILAQNTASYSLVAIPFDLPKEGLSEHIRKLAEAFALDAQEVEVKLKNVSTNSFEPVVIKQDLRKEESILFETRASEFIGFSIYKIPIREYLNPEIYSHVLGYTGLVSPGDLENVDRSRYNTTDYIGKSGIELQYEEYLHGINGQNLVEVDASGRLQRVLGENQPEPGNSAILNIDKELQDILYQTLKGSSENIKAAAVAMNPTNGQVLALVSLPGFDNNLFAHGIKQAQYQVLLEDKRLPLFNRAIAGVYPPGSTIKPVAAAAVLQEQIVDENTVIVDRGVLVIPNQFNPAISYNFYGWKRTGLGPMNVRSAIAQSSDIYFYTVAGGHPSSHIDGIGAEKLTEYYRTFNLGALTGIDLRGEKPGVVADPAWKAEYFGLRGDQILSKWYLGDTYHIAIGQGDMLATPLQVALWTSIVANKGVGYKPEILNRIVDKDGRLVMENQPQVIAQPPVSPENIRIVQEGMRQTIVSGSAKRLNALPITSAGKTGTSQFDGADPSRTHAWFTAYAPYENPQIVITVLVEAGGEGSSVSVPVVQEVLKWWAEYRLNN